MREGVLEHFTLGGMGLSVLASQACFLIENDVCEEQTDWTGGGDSDPTLRKETWKIAWEARVQPGLLTVKTLPPSTFLRRPELRASLEKFLSASFSFQRNIVLCELAAFEGYWPTQVADTDFKRLFLVTEVHEEYLRSVSRDLGFSENAGLELRQDIEACWADLCPNEYRLPGKEYAEWTMTIMGRCLAAPFLERHPLLVTHPDVHENPVKLIRSALSSLGVGMTEIQDRKERKSGGALGAGGILLDEENSHSWNDFADLPVESQAMIAAKFLVFMKRFLNGPDVQPERREAGVRICALQEKIDELCEDTSDPNVKLKHQMTLKLLSCLAAALQP